MIRSTFLIILLSLFMGIKNSNAQTPLAYEKGNQALKFGVGLGAPFSTGNIKLPPLQAIYEYGITEDISIGGVLGYSSSSENYSSLGKIDFSYLIFGGRGNYHFETSEKFDPYGGVTLGYAKLSMKDQGAGVLGDLAESAVIYGAQIGANYYFTPNVGAWAEVGYGIGYLNVGVVFKF